MFICNIRVGNVTRNVPKAAVPLSGGLKGEPLTSEQNNPCSVYSSSRTLLKSHEISLPQTNPCFKWGYHLTTQEWRKSLLPAVTGLFVILCTRNIFLSFPLFHPFPHLLWIQKTMLIIIISIKVEGQNKPSIDWLDIILGWFTFKCLFSPLMLL